MKFKELSVWFGYYLLLLVVVFGLIAFFVVIFT